jgi:hypothetical protein
MRPSHPLFARLVLNHSTLVDGLLPVLRSLEASNLISTICPGRLYTTRSSSVNALTLRITTGIGSEEDGYAKWKLLARTKSNVQEVFITTARDKDTNTVAAFRNHLESHLTKLLKRGKCKIGK